MTEVKWPIHQMWRKPLKSNRALLVCYWFHLKTGEPITCSYKNTKHHHLYKTFNKSKKGIEIWHVASGNGWLLVLSTKFPVFSDCWHRHKYRNMFPIKKTFKPNLFKFCWLYSTFLAQYFDFTLNNPQSVTHYWIYFAFFVCFVLQIIY